MESTPTIPGEQFEKEHLAKTVTLLITIGLVLIVGVGIVLPQVIVITNTLTSIPQDQVRKSLSSDYISPEVKNRTGSLPTDIMWQSKPLITLNIFKYPILQSYGYNWAFMLNQSGDVVRAVPNASATLFATQSPGINWNSPTEGYPVSSAIILNSDLSYFKVMPMPKLTDGCCNAVLAWLGNRYLLINEFMPGVYPPGAGNYFYVGDTASSTINKTFQTISVPPDLLSKQYLGLTALSHPTEPIAVLSYCLNTVQEWDSHYCSEYGISIATPQRIVQLLKKNTRNSFKVGWDENNLYILETDRDTGAVNNYYVEISPYKNDQFIDNLSEHKDPTSHGTPAWIKYNLPVTQKINLLSFDVNFDATSSYAMYSRGFLTIDINDKPVGKIYEEQEPHGLHKKTFYFPTLPIGNYIFEIMEESYNPYVHSNIDIKNFKFGYATSTNK